MSVDRRKCSTWTGLSARNAEYPPSTDSDYNSPYRTGQHVPLAQNRHAPLTSVATTASESRADVSYPYFEESGRAPLNTSAYPASPVGYPRSPGHHSPSPYSPGNRSA